MNDIWTQGNGDTAAFHHIGLQINAKSMVTDYGNSSLITVKCLISYIVIFFSGKSLKLFPPDVIFKS